MPLELESTIYHTQDKHANYLTTDTVWIVSTFLKLHVGTKNVQPRYKNENNKQTKILGQIWLYIRPIKNMCVYGHPTDPIFRPPTLTFFIGNYSAP